MPPVIKVIFGFGLVIFLHELGHFLMARKNGVYVEKFAIGFDYPFALFSWTGKTGTRYVVGPLPLGGYVKMLGQNELPSEVEDPSRMRSDSFQAKTVWQRTQIISAGVIANFVSAFALCYLAFVVGFHASPPAVGAVGFDSLQSGLRPGDIVTEVEGKKVASWEDIFVKYATLEPGADVEMVVERDGNSRVINAPVHRDPAEPFNRPDFGRPLVPRVRTVVVDSAADRAGLEPGDWLVAIDGQGISSWSGFSEMIRRRGDKDIVVTVRREVDGEDQTVDLQAHPASKTPDEVPSKTLGFQPEEPPVLGFVDPAGPAHEAGAQVGDVVLAVNGAPVGNWYALWKAVSWYAEEGARVELRLKRGATEVDVFVTPVEASNWALGTHALSPLGIAGPIPDALVVGEVMPGGPAAQAGLVQGDVVREFEANVTGEPGWTVSDPNWDTLLYALNSLEDDTLSLEIERAGERRSVQLAATDANESIRIGFIGVGPMVREDLIKMSPSEALVPALLKPWQILDQFVAGLQAMFMRRMSARMISGPVGILRATHTFAKKSTGDLLVFLALLSVNLAVVNFLPIPITDGGHFMFLMYEKFKGRKMDEELQARFQWAGLVFILMIFLFATFNDVGMIFGF
ncbi:MAG: RIP metalloprotease RseP [Deltaproteobacteria bacterium]|nr:RIP metalloprotease RseP [Deltaproteobacteria bacterium]